MAFGRLERTQGQQPISDINITPLVDVMLVLVVIFIVAAPLLASQIRLDLPEAEGTSAASPTPSVAVVLDSAGQVYWADQPVTLPELGERLQQTAQNQPATEVQLRADAAVPYGRVVEVMGAAHRAGLHRIGFVAEPVR